MAEVWQVSRDVDTELVQVVLGVNGQQIEIWAELMDCTCRDSYVDLGWKATPAKLGARTYYNLVNRLQVELGRMPTGDEIRERIGEEATDG